ncbi:DUF3299 domain-containing protein [Alteromonas halophila]|uniref:DUF3299 domain-containing protein n=1 Tax=Alteromonas halophila TaxID=516698 RepID=A0A918JJW5_9ALTE|nr:DUF3299 domain-containing protein [Alteromonas halophila]GGW84157.1 hypothetical protein GCM10007391_17330 [Alteromonas halophila]
MNVRVVTYLFTVFSLLLTLNVNAAEPKEVYWEDLVPEGFNELSPNAVGHENRMAQVQPNAPVVDKYDGMRVKIPGFVVPLEGTVNSTTEFLLVPYFGACIHVPPPPSNQIVYVKFEEGIAISNLSDAIWVTGTLSTEGWSGDIASVGYRLTGENVAPF